MTKSKEQNIYYHHNNLREAIILEILKILETKTLSSINVRGLSDRLGVSSTAIYRHFSSKEHLFKAVILKGFEQLDAELRIIFLDDQKNIKYKIYDIGKTYIDFAIASPARYRLMLSNQLTKLKEESCDFQNTSLENTFFMIVSLFEMAQKTGLFLPKTPQKQAIVFFAMIHGQASLFLDGHSMIREEKEKIFEMTFEVMMRGLKE